MTNGFVAVVVEFDLMECEDFEDDDDDKLRSNSRLLEQRNAVDEARLKPKAALSD